MRNLHSWPQKFIFYLSNLKAVENCDFNPHLKHRHFTVSLNTISLTMKPLLRNKTHPLCITLQDNETKYLLGVLRPRLLYLILFMLQMPQETLSISVEFHRQNISTRIIDNVLLHKMHLNWNTAPNERDTRYYWLGHVNAISTEWAGTCV